MKKTCPIELPEQVQGQIAAMPEHSCGVNRVTLILANGAEIPDVYVGWAKDILRVGRSSELDFDPDQVVGARHQP